MTALEMKARAKINLSLDVTGKRPDGYHDLRMIMQTVDLYDSVYLEIADSDIEVVSSSPYAPGGPDNTAYKAAKLIFDEFSIKSGIRISVTKRIPVAAGLAGGSSDAAAVLKGMNQLFSLGLGDEELMSIGKKVGADVPYCIKGGTMLAEGIGDVLTPLEPLKNVDIVLIKPAVGVSTQWVYKSLKLENITKRPDTGILVKSIEDRNIDILAKSMVNVLETVTIARHPVIASIKDRLIREGAVGSAMSGSGPTVIGIFRNRFVARRAFESFRSFKGERFITKTICEER